ncbi:MAG: rhomboid family intramembrane serine protease [bacterium]|nr:rhomboid family intramembrane serine protease [bacterium]
MPFSRMPPVTRVLLTINVSAFIVINWISPMLGGEAAFVGLIQSFGLTPAAFWQGAFWQPLTSMFLHASLLHIAANMLGVWSIGSMLERGIGSGRYLWLYMISGFAGALLVLMADPASTRPTIGASGAVLGLLGAVAVLSPNSMLLFIVFPVRARTAALLIGVGSLLLEYTGSMGTISHLGHLGGLIGGYLYTRFALSAGETQARMHRASRGPTGPSGFDRIFGGGSRGPGPFGGGAAGPDAGYRSDTRGGGRGSREEAILRMMEQMLRGAAGQGRPGDPGDPSAGPGPRGPGDFGQPPREKVINPMPDEGSGPKSGASPRSPNPNPGGTPGGGKHVVYFDPITGRFQIKEV